MEVSVPFDSTGSDGLQPGDLYLHEVQGKLYPAIVVHWSNDDVGGLILEGPSAGDLDAIRNFGVPKYAGPTILEVSPEAEHWYKGAPTGALSVSVQGGNAYFVFLIAGRYYAVNAATGEEARLPSDGLYSSKWSIRFKDQEHPFIKSPIA